MKKESIRTLSSFRTTFRAVQYRRVFKRIESVYTSFKQSTSSERVKYRGYVDASGRRFLDDVVIYRYADLLLLLAEAKNALSQDPSEEINKVRQRAYGDAFESFQFVSSSKEANDEAILQERMLELAFEGKRWWDLLRFDKAFEKVPSLQNRTGQNYLELWPISLSTISLNSNITQNTGYGN